MNWIKEPPKEPGAWWARWGKNKLVINVFSSNGRMFGHLDCGAPLDDKEIYGEAEWGSKVLTCSEQAAIEAENERLRKALEGIAAMIPRKVDHEDCNCVDCERNSAIAAAREALGEAAALHHRD